MPTGLLEDVDLAELQRAIALNVEINILCTQALVPGMVKQGQRRVINIGSRAALGKPARTLYSMTKAGVIGLTRTWALELAPKGITVNTVAPGPRPSSFSRLTLPTTLPHAICGKGFLSGASDSPKMSRTLWRTSWIHDAATLPARPTMYVAVSLPVSRKL